MPAAGFYLLLPSGSKGIYLGAAPLFSLGKFFREPFLADSILEPRIGVEVELNSSALSSHLAGEEIGMSEARSWENGRKMVSRRFPRIGVGAENLF